MRKSALLLLLLALLVLGSPAARAEPSFAEAKARLQKGLRSSNVSERANAVYELDGFDTPQAVKILVRAVLVRDDRARVIAAAIQLLGAMRDEKSLTALAAEAKSGGWRRRARVLEALGKTRTESAFDTLLGAAYDEDPRVRISALSSFENFEDGRADLALVDALESPSWPVRSAAITAIRHRTPKSAIPALIGRLKPGVEAGRLRGDVAGALSRITNQQFGVCHETWKKWFDELTGPGGGNLPPKPAGGSQVVPTARMAGVPTFAKRILIVLAIHKSMLDPIPKRGPKAAPREVQAMRDPAALKPWTEAATKIEIARLWVEWTIQNFGPEVEFNVVTYGSSADAAFSDYVPATPANRQKAVRRVTSLSAGGNSSLWAGLRRSFTIIAKDPVDLRSMSEGPEVVFFVSDGSSDYGEIKEAYRAFEEAERWNLYRQVMFHCIGVGQHDDRVLADMANMGPGGAKASIP